MAATQSLRILESLGVAVTLHPYAYDPMAEAVGLAAAAALGLDAAWVLKTLMVEVDGKAACCVIPSDRQLSMKRVAAAFGGKQAAMMAVPQAEKLTGYRVGGISPFGQRRAVPVAMELGVLEAEKVWINAGQRGLLLGIAPKQACAAVKARTAVLIA